MELKDKVAVITGGASGLGKATVLRFQAAGAKCAIFDLNEEAGAALAEQLGDSVSFHQVNVADEESVSKAIGQAMENFGAIHICCNYSPLRCQTCR